MDTARFTYELDFPPYKDAEQPVDTFPRAGSWYYVSGPVEQHRIPGTYIAVDKNASV